MEELSKEELLHIQAGGISWGAVGIFAAIATFLVGVVDGYIRPLPCNQ